MVFNDDPVTGKAEALGQLAGNRELLLPSTPRRSSPCAKRHQAPSASKFCLSSKNPAGFRV